MGEISRTSGISGIVPSAAFDKTIYSSVTHVHHSGLLSFHAKYSTTLISPMLGGAGPGSMGLVQLKLHLERVPYFTEIVCRFLHCAIQSHLVQLRPAFWNLHPAWLGDDFLVHNDDQIQLQQASCVIFCWFLGHSNRFCFDFHGLGDDNGVKRRATSTQHGRNSCEHRCLQ